MRPDGPRLAFLEFWDNPKLYSPQAFKENIFRTTIHNMYVNQEMLKSDGTALSDAIFIFKHNTELCIKRQSLLLIVSPVATLLPQIKLT